MQKTENISFLEISSIPQLVKDFLNKKLKDFNDFVFDESLVKSKTENKQKFFTSGKREILHQVLSNQLYGLQLSENQTFNVNSILSENTFTVTTGHQLNLFTGPVFFIYKILQTIKLAEVLNENYPESHFVPIFWMATEDHDFDEINHFRTENDFFEIKGKSGGAVGKIEIEDTFFISQFAEDFKDSVFGTELLMMMKRAYRKGNTLAEATRILVHELFSEYGLLMIDGDERELKNQMKTIFRNELLHETLFNSTQNKIDFLKSEYGKVQVNPREINLFYLSESRNRIEKFENQFHIVDTEITFSEKEILSELENSPEKFSPNAVLRPAFQESVLPNIAYIGGNAEIMYWLELPDYFSEAGIPFPFLVPRNSMLMISEKNFSKIQKSGLEFKDFLQDFATLSKDFLLEKNEISGIIQQKEESLKKQFADLKQIAECTDKTFGNLVAAEKTRQLKSFDKMRKRLLRAEKIKQKEKLERLENLFLEIHPRGIWQERVYNFSVFYADNGKEWLQNCYVEMSSANSELIVFKL